MRMYLRNNKKLFPQQSLASTSAVAAEQDSNKLSREDRFAVQVGMELRLNDILPTTTQQRRVNESNNTNIKISPPATSAGLSPGSGLQFDPHQTLWHCTYPNLKQKVFSYIQKAGIDPLEIHDALRLAYMILEFGRWVVIARTLIPMTYIPATNSSTVFAASATTGSKGKNNNRNSNAADRQQALSLSVGAGSCMSSASSASAVHPVDRLYKELEEERNAYERIKQLLPPISFGSSTIAAAAAAAMSAAGATSRIATTAMPLSLPSVENTINNIQYLQTQGIKSKLTCCQWENLDELKIFLRFSVHISERFNFLRAQVVNYYVALCMDHKHFKLSEFLCRMLQSPQGVPEYSDTTATTANSTTSAAAATAPAATGAEAVTSATAATTQKHRRIQSLTEGATEFLSFLQSFTIENFLDKADCPSLLAHGESYQELLTAFPSFTTEDCVCMTAEESNHIYLLYGIFNNSGILSSNETAKRTILAEDSEASLHIAYKVANDLLLQISSIFGLLALKVPLYVYDVNVFIAQAQAKNPLLLLVADSIQQLQQQWEGGWKDEKSEKPQQ